MLLNYTFESFKQLVVESGFPAYRALQVFDWVFKKATLSPDLMTNLPEAMRIWLKTLNPSVLTQVERQDSSDAQTFKFLWKLHDESLVESVLIEAPGRLTLCVSSQVGCAARCAFCASGKEGLIRNLSCAEILEQFIRVQAYLKLTDRSLTHLVYMGMGEPLHNVEAVVQSIRMLADDQGAKFSTRRVTLSTVGVVEGIEQLEKLDLGINLVLSLHAPNHDVRKRIIPLARKYPLEVVLAACDHYSASTGRDMTYEYTLLEGINDSPEQAYELADLLKNRQCTVNLIPYNPILGMKLKRPSQEAIEAFRAVLFERGINHTCRYTKGVDIAAACGQLALRKSHPLLPLVSTDSQSTVDFQGKASSI